MSWHTPGPAARYQSGNTTKVITQTPVHTVTGATNMREHRRILREQAEARNARTPEHKRKKNRLAKDHTVTQLEQLLKPVGWDTMTGGPAHISM